MLTPNQELLWNDYLAAEGRGTRAAKIQALDAFVALLKTSPTSEWRDWAYEIAKQVVDDNQALVIRTPLFRDVVFPALLEGHRNSVPGCARWLAGLSQHIFRCPDCRSQLPEYEQSEFGLLQTALRVNPADVRSAQRLIAIIAGRLRYTLHELPTGVLYGIDGATAEECLGLQTELQDFAELAERYGRRSEFQSLIDNCDFHYREYRAYLLDHTNFASYAAYLDKSHD